MIRDIGWNLRDWILFALLFIPSINSWTRNNDRFSHVTTKLNSAVDSSPQQATNHNIPSYFVRNCRYDELVVVADIIMASFYQSNVSPFNRLFRIAELNRLQQNFPYNDGNRHVMLVAICSNTKEVVAFCDLDSRPPSRPTDPPRPYLSDLAVAPEFRRRGIAKLMVETSEQVAQSDMKKSDIYMKVEDKNVAAVLMYNKLGYEELGRTFSSNGKAEKTILLKKHLS